MKVVPAPAGHRPRKSLVDSCSRLLRYLEERNDILLLML